MKDLRIRVAGIIKNGRDILLIAHKKDDMIYWLLPGGGVRFGEPMQDALRREFKEELGIEIDVNKLAMVFDSIDPSGKRHILNICFHCTLSAGELRLGHEKRLYDYKFFPPEMIHGIPMYPPINEHLMAIINNTNESMYLGNIWLDR
jgi:ADP-ribose pyrophosphatase YjhB (NUDIX family)